MADTEIELTATTIDINGDADVSGTLTVGTFSPSNLTATGNLSVQGNTTLGNAVTDTITFTGRIASGTDLIPIADSVSDLGTTALRFQHLYVDAITGATISGGTF